jgi:hypothetical protein
MLSGQPQLLLPLPFGSSLRLAPRSRLPRGSTSARSRSMGALDRDYFEIGGQRRSLAYRRL